MLRLSASVRGTIRESADGAVVLLRSTGSRIPAIVNVNPVIENLLTGSPLRNIGSPGEGELLLKDSFE